MNNNTTAPVAAHGFSLLSASELKEPAHANQPKMPIFEEMASTSVACNSLSSSTSSSRKSLKQRKDLTAVGQATNLAAVALLLNTNRTVNDAETGTNYYHSEPERISNYRNSVAFMDAEVEALLGRRKSSKFLPR